MALMKSKKQCNDFQSNEEKNVKEKKTKYLDGADGQNRYQGISKTKMAQGNKENSKIQQIENDKMQDSTEKMKVQMIKDKQARGTEENGNYISLSQNMTQTVTQGNTVHVSKPCQHVCDKRCGVILTPSTLVHTQDHTHAQKEKSISSLIKKSWPTRRYGDLCTCCEAGEVCHCKGTGSETSICQRFLPRNAPWWPKTKIILLTVAGLLPWVFLIVYFVFTYKK